MRVPVTTLFRQKLMEWTADIQHSESERKTVLITSSFLMQLSSIYISFRHFQRIKVRIVFSCVHQEGVVPTTISKFGFTKFFFPICFMHSMTNRHLCEGQSRQTQWPDLLGVELLPVHFVISKACCCRATCSILLFLRWLSTSTTSSGH